MSGKEIFAQRVNVSRETLSRLEGLERLLRKWNAAINLVSANTLEQVWTRHFLDSAQIFELAPETAKTWVDLGSGGGFPGLVVGILAKEARPDLRLTLVESDKRKAAFLIAAIRELGLNAVVRAERIEAAAPQHADVLSARALAALPLLLEFTERHLSRNGVALFPKGETWREELAQAQQTWSFQVEALPSQTDTEAVILRIKGLSRV